MYTFLINTGSHITLLYRFNTTARRPNAPLTSRRQMFGKIITDFQAKVRLLYIFLKKFILHLKTKTKKKKRIKDVVHRECMDNCSLHFFLV